MLAGQIDDQDHRRALQTIADHAQRASDMVSELLDFAKPDPPQPTQVDLLPWLEKFRADRLAGSSLEPEQFQIQVSSSDIAVRVDPDQFTRILDALVANALEAMTAQKPRLVINSPSGPSDESVVVMLEDNGMGMSPDVAEHALDPFFSHRPAGRGRGLGLSRAHSLTVANGGRLWLDSTEGAGTTVFVELPAASPIRD